MWEVKAGVQVSNKEFHIHIHLDYARIKILSCIKKIKNKKLKKNTKKNNVMRFFTLNFSRRRHLCKVLGKGIDQYPLSSMLDYMSRPHLSPTFSHNYHEASSKK